MTAPGLASIVRVVATVADPDFDQPWAPRSSRQVTGTAIAIANGELLCAASIVTNALEVHVVTLDFGGRVKAEVRANHDCDLALLVVPGSRLPAVALAELPAIGDEVAVLGATEDGPLRIVGSVSRIAVQRYSHSQRHLLVAGVDVDTTAIDGCGPVMAGDRLAGILVQRVADDPAQLDIVPAPVIAAFLEAARHGRLQVPALGVTTQNLENPRLRRHLGLHEGEQGVVVTHVDHGGSGDGVLQRDDVLVTVADAPISNAGLVRYRDDAFVRYDGLVGEHQLGDRIPVTVRRRGVDGPLALELALGPWLPLVPRAQHDRPARYFVYGGLVFQPLTRDYLTTWDEWWHKAPKEMLDLYYLGHRTAERREVVVLTQVLDDDLNVGYGHMYNEVVASVNGRAPVDFEAFVVGLELAVGEVRIETTAGSIAVFDAAEVRAAAPRILERHGIGRARQLG